MNLWDCHCLCTPLRCSHSSSGISTIFSIALCLITSDSSSFPYCWVCSFACCWLCSFTFLGSGVPSLAVFRMSPSMPALPVQDIGAAVPRGHRSRSCEALFPRTSRPTSLTSSLGSCTVVLFCHRGLLVHDSNLLLAVVCRTSATSLWCGHLPHAWSCSRVVSLGLLTFFSVTFQNVNPGAGKGMGREGRRDAGGANGQALWPTLGLSAWLFPSQAKSTKAKFNSGQVLPRSIPLAPRPFLLRAVCCSTDVILCELRPTGGTMIQCRRGSFAPGGRSILSNDGNSCKGRP